MLGKKSSTGSQDVLQDPWANKRTLYNVPLLHLLGKRGSSGRQYQVPLLHMLGKRGQSYQVRGAPDYVLDQNSVPDIVAYLSVWNTWRRIRSIIGEAFQQAEDDAHRQFPEGFPEYEQGSNALDRLRQSPDETWLDIWGRALEAWMKKNSLRSVNPQGSGLTWHDKQNGQGGKAKRGVSETSPLEWDRGEPLSLNSQGQQEES